MAISIKALVGKFVQWLIPVRSRPWSEAEYFDEQWKQRVQLMSTFIPPRTESVMDLGCGKMWLKEFLPAGCLYLGVDYKPRDENTLVFDLDKYQYPGVSASIVFASGIIEYVSDYKWLVEKIAASGRTAIISYCATDFFPNLVQRRRLNWINDLSEREIIGLFSQQGMQLRSQTKTPSNNSIFVFEK